MVGNSDNDPGCGLPRTHHGALAEGKIVILYV